MRTRLILCIALSFAACRGQAQLLDSIELETAYIYTSLEEALKEPYKVYRLHLNKKKLTVFPPEIFLFENLQDLDLSKNRLTELPDSLGKLKKLQILNVSGNNLELLPKSVGELTNLKKFYANKNKLTALPAHIGNLTGLRVLDLWSNEIGYFPEDMKNMKSLRKLDLRNILINDETQSKLREWLPNTKIYMDPDCKCTGGG
ncbi:MAG: leucine-rich repeat domain-containing protein [Bacteroidia bacterium]|nr:leucine-rich repeat domain-containing protein [Bacteroidia bacterium]